MADHHTIQSTRQVRRLQFCYTCVLLTQMHREESEDIGTVKVPRQHNHRQHDQPRVAVGSQSPCAHRRVTLVILTSR